MNYAGHNIRTNLQEHKNRLARTTYSQFGNQLKYFLNYLTQEKMITGILSDVTSVFPMSTEQFNNFLEHASSGKQISFENEVDQVAYNYQFINHFVVSHSYEIHKYSTFQRQNFEETKERIIENFVSPILNYLHDTIDKSNSVLYLLEKYKRRTEWFTRKQLHDRYITEQVNFEQIFEDDLRLFLFDQGIEYPFSTPHSPSGRADVVGQLETEDPLVVEIKIFDRNKGYGKERIKSGLSQIIKYANDYNKSVGYLVIFNLDTTELNLRFDSTKLMFPPNLEFNAKIFYFIVVNIAPGISASKIGKTEAITVTNTELLDLVSTI